MAVPAFWDGSTPMLTKPQLDIRCLVLKIPAIQLLRLVDLYALMHLQLLPVLLIINTPVILILILPITRYPTSLDLIYRQAANHIPNSLHTTFTLLCTPIALPSHL
ncbi:hypothetical protein CVT25_006784 [Psilocybe cyanescens]|uniref:Uncharacterized protein n=1 Tax=Psilocybe cyanescens TaxID=93625 RepID=A0A409W7A3_PSICY|nr:hypothetical protein CVT25_006784 [Psilocybe cyanescens]